MSCNYSIDVFLSDGTVNSTTEAGNPFDQDLNTTDDDAFSTLIVGDELIQSKISLIDKNYHNSLLNFNKWALYEHEQKVFNGKILNVDNMGLLNLELKNGEYKKFNLKQIKLVK